ncbi:MAG TPA: hypothetical protein VFC51_12150 [Chloroflexota bacterium]|nr:hypothetical protein [Chloroflexota bacterium]
MCSITLLASPNLVVGTPGDIYTVVGNGVQGFGGDGGPATAASINSGYGVAVDANGNLFIADLGNNRVRKIDAFGTISTIAGNGTRGFAGDGSPAVAAQFDGPADVAVDRVGNLFIADTGNRRIRRVDTSGIISTMAGYGDAGCFDSESAATSAVFGNPRAVAVDADGNVFVADEINNHVRRIDTSGIISTVAGQCTPGFSGDGGPATAAHLAGPSGIAVGSSGNLFIADDGNNRVRMVNAAGLITTIAGTGEYGLSGDGGPATQAMLQGPRSVAVGGNGSVYISDTGNHRVRRVDSAAIISTFAGVGPPGGFGGDGGPAIEAMLWLPMGLAAGPDGALLVADLLNFRIRKIAGASVCGDGIIDAGEACDDDNTANGDCCSSTCQIEPATTVCRPAAGSCDVPETCDGVSPTCPSDHVAAVGVVCRPVADRCDVAETCNGGDIDCPSDVHLPDGDGDGLCDTVDGCPFDFDPSQTDTDGDGLGDVCDPCTLGVSIRKPLLRLSDFTTPHGDDRLTFQGTLEFSGAPIFDPTAQGLRVLVNDPVRRTIVDLGIPGGTYSSSAKTGWRTNARHSRFVFGGALVDGSMARATVVREVADHKRIRFLVKASRSSFERVFVGPLSATLILDPPTAETGSCGELTFAGPPPLPSCSFNRNRRLLTCR